MSDAIVLADEQAKLFPVLRGWAHALSNLAPEQVPAAFDMALQFKKLGEDVYDNLRDKLLAAVKETGEKVTDKGSMKAMAGGFAIMAIPTKTGTDPKKFEALLRAKKLDPAIWMDSLITYKLNPTKMLRAVVSGMLSQDDVDSCAYPPAYRVQVEREGE